MDTWMKVGSAAILAFMLWRLWPAANHWMKNGPKGSTQGLANRIHCFSGCGRLCCFTDHDGQISLLLALEDTHYIIINSISCF